MFQKTLNVQTYLSPAKLRAVDAIVCSPNRRPIKPRYRFKLYGQNTGDARLGLLILPVYCRQNLTGYCDIPGRTISLNAGETPH